MRFVSLLTLFAMLFGEINMANAFLFRRQNVTNVNVNVGNVPVQQQQFARRNHYVAQQQLIIRHHQQFVAPQQNYYVAQQQLITRHHRQQFVAPIQRNIIYVPNQNLSIQRIQYVPQQQQVFVPQQVQYIPVPQQQLQMQTNTCQMSAQLQAAPSYTCQQPQQLQANPGCYSGTQQFITPLNFTRNY